MKRLALPIPTAPLLAALCFGLCSACQTREQIADGARFAYWPYGLGWGPIRIYEDGELWLQDTILDTDCNTWEQVRAEANEEENTLVRVELSPQQRAKVEAALAGIDVARLADHYDGEPPWTDPLAYCFVFVGHAGALRVVSYTPYGKLSVDELDRLLRAVEEAVLRGYRAFVYPF